jgi:phage host-nuclease inhibitor protein Gam
MQLKSAEKGFEWPPRGRRWSFRADRTACSREDHPAAARAAASRINAVSRLAFQDGLFFLLPYSEIVINNMYYTDITKTMKHTSKSAVPARFKAPNAMPAVNSIESLDAGVSEIIRLRAQRAARLAELEARLAAVQEAFARPIAELDHQLLDRESAVQNYCHAHRAELFAAKKSRETHSAVIGFELSPHRVETAGRRVTWRTVVSALLGLDWGRAYVRQPEPQLNKDVLLADRHKLTPDQLAAAGIRFAQAEQFYIRSKTGMTDIA